MPHAKIEHKGEHYFISNTSLPEYIRFMRFIDEYEAEKAKLLFTQVNFCGYSKQQLD